MSSDIVLPYLKVSDCYVVLRSRQNSRHCLIYLPERRWAEALF